MVHVGLDMHKRFSEVAVLDDAGAVLDRCTLHHDDPQALTEYFRNLGGDATVTVEATRGWYWLADLIESEGPSVKLAHPTRVRLIAEARVKTDKIDAWVLAHLERLDFLPEAYIPPQEVRDRRELLRYRLGLVSLNTVLKNRVHALLAKLGIILRQTDLFGKSGREFLAELELREVYRRVLDGNLAAIDFLAGEVKRVTGELRAGLKGDPRAELLKSIPGVGILTAYLLLAEIGDIERFASAKRLCSYAGLVPRTYASGGKCWQGGITRQGNRYIRYAMVEAAQVATRKDVALDLFYQRLKREKGAGRARVAVAVAKRRHGLINLEGGGISHRSVLGKYSEALLDQMMAVATSATVIAYCLYTIAPETVDKFGSSNLIFTFPFVLYGIYRYLYLVYRKELGGAPEKVFVTDLPMIIDVLLYGAVVVFVLYVKF